MLITGNLPGLESKLLQMALKNGIKVGGYLRYSDDILNIPGEFKIIVENHSKTIRKKNLKCADVVLYFRVHNITKEEIDHPHLINPSVTEIKHHFFMNPNHKKMYVISTKILENHAYEIVKNFYLGEN